MGRLPTITPGPNNFLLASSGAQFGVMNSCRHIIGIRIGIIGLLLLCACGVGVALQSNPNWYQALKLIGLSYMFWFMIKLLCTNPFSGKTTKNKPLNITQATFFQLGNIKAWMSSIALVSSYSLPSHYWFSVVLILCTFTIVGLFSNIFWVCVGKKFSVYLNTPLKQRYFNLSLAAMILVSILPVLDTLL